MLITMLVGIFQHPMFWWLILPLIGVTLLVMFMLWESRLPKNLANRK
jgi:hypothetical protein